MEANVRKCNTQDYLRRHSHNYHGLRSIGEITIDARRYVWVVADV